MILPTKKVQNVEVRMGEGVFIDGEHFPYPVAASPGFMVEELPTTIPTRPEHILWVPLIASGVAPTVGPPDAETWEPPVTEPEPAGGPAGDDERRSA